MTELRLNETAYAHRKIRMLCFQLETLTGLKLVTNLSEEFHEVRFMNELSYIVIDFKRNAYYTLSVFLDEKIRGTIEDILLETSWLYIGYNWENLARLRERKQKKNAIKEKRKEDVK